MGSYTGEVGLWWELIYDEKFIPQAINAIPRSVLLLVISAHVLGG